MPTRLSIARAQPHATRSPRIAAGPDPSLPWTPHAASRWLMPALLACFVGGGFAALVYEIVWFQLLEYTLGASAISVGILLAAYMSGLCLGSHLAARLRDRIDPMRAYALMEIGIGLLGLAILSGLPIVNRLYGGLGASGPWDLALRAAIAGTCLLPPTVLMGATLPTVAAWVESTPRGIARVGGLYAANTAGAIAGCLVAGFYLLRLHDMATVTYTAVGTNLALGVSALAMASALPARRPAPRLVAQVPGQRPDRVILFVIALSGACALGAEVVWTRLMALLLGQTVYTFSIILGVLLAGLSLGSWLGSLRARASHDPARDLGLCQALLAGAIAWASFMLSRSLPYWPVSPALDTSPWIDFQLDLVRCAWVILPAALLWGASFPLALSASTAPGADPRRVVAWVYSANTVGAIAGALLFTFWLVPSFGTEGAERALVAVAGASGAIVLASRRPRGAGRRRALAVASLLAAVMLMRLLPPVPAALIAYGRSLANRLGTRNPVTHALVPLPRVLYVGEGLNESVAVSATDRVRQFHVSGKTEASTAPEDMRLQRMLGELPALMHPEPRSVLVVGFGAGVTAGSFVPFPSVQRIVICEIEPLIPKCVAPFFAAENHGVAQDPRVTIVYDDARHYLLTSKDKFDVITSDPIHPWVKGSAALYSEEYFDLVRQHLNPDGVVSQWLPLYQSSETTIRGEVATFFTAFPGGTLWANNAQGKGYDMVMVGSNRPQAIDLVALNARLRRPDHAGVIRSLQELGYRSAADFLASYAGRQRDLAPWLAGAEINHDSKLWLQYQAGLETTREDEAEIADHLSNYRAFPEDLFVGPGELKDAIRTPEAEPGGE